jgi:hypothetical protein
MILNDLFESRMSELDIEYQDYKNLEPVAFYSRYKMTKDEWASKHWSLIKGSETVHEGAVKDLHTDLADKYRELAPSIEKYKDSFLAGQLYDALEAIAIEHGAELEFKRMMTGARNRAHMDYDTNPGGFQNWFWYLPFADDEQLDEIDRRGFLKGLGAAAVAGGAGYVGGVRRVQNTTLARVLGKLNGFLKPLKASKVKDKWSYDLIIRTRDLIEKYKIDPDIIDYREYSFGENQGERAYSMAFRNGIQTEQDREKYESMLFELSADLMNATAFHPKYMESFEQGVIEEQSIEEKQDACYRKVKSRYKVWPSAYASGALVQCRKKGAANWGNKSKK